MKNLGFDLTSLREAYAQGLDPHAVIDLVFARIAAADDPGIFISLRDIADVREAARAIGPYDATKPLWGAPFAVKDNIDAAGLPTTAACKDFAYTPAENAPAVARLLEAGAILIGKTNLDQFATGLVGVRTPYAVPRNTFDPAIVPGGSSSGSGVAVARGIVSFALGTDTAGSGRVPAGLNNIVGLKPSLGAVSARGVVPACRSLDCVSVFAGTVDDAWDVYRIMAAFDPGDPFSREIALSALGPVPPQLRIGIPGKKSRVFGGDAQSERAYEAALADLAALGATFHEIDLVPFFDTARLLYEGPWVAERHAAVRAFLAQSPGAFLDVTRKIIASAERFSATDLFEASYKLMALRRSTAPVWQGIDALVVPTYPRPPKTAELDADPIGPNSELGTYTNFVNLLDLCALAVPSRFRRDGFPSGVTLIAPRAQDGFLASIGGELHRRAGAPLGATGLPLPPMRERAAAALAGEIEIVAVGAHMSGLALNHELKTLGARFLRTAETKPDYRLFALAGGPPARPGLLRVAGGEGRAIAAEVWAMSPAAFGTFVASIPSPLGIGTLRLADGSAPKGFLAEAEAVHDARDISDYGGWRAFAAAN